MNLNHNEYVTYVQSLKYCDFIQFMMQNILTTDELLIAVQARRHLNDPITHTHQYLLDPHEAPHESI